MKRFVITLILILAIPVVAISDPNDSVEGLTAELLQNNPELKSLENLQVAEEAVPSQVSSLDDPIVGIEASDIPADNLSTVRSPMSGWQVSLKQKVPFPGKLRLQKRQAKIAASEAGDFLREKRNQLIAKFKMGLYDWLFNQQALSITRQTIRDLAALVKSLEMRYSAGSISQQDVLKTKTELSKRKGEAIRLEKMLVDGEAYLKSLLNRKGEERLTVQSPAPRLTPVDFSLAALKEKARHARPWLEKMRHEVERHETGHRLAKRGLLPDFDFSVGYGIGNDDLNDSVGKEDFVSAGVMINIPIWAWRKQGKAIREKRYRWKAAQYQSEATEQEALYQVESLHAAMEEASQLYHLYRTDLTPQASAALNASRRSYEAGLVDYQNLITGVIDLLESQLNESRYFYEHEKRVAELEMATGGFDVTQ